MGILDKLRNNKEGICETCGNLIQATESLLGCEAKDRIILPQYAPYHGNEKCKDWKAKV